MGESVARLVKEEDDDKLEAVADEGVDEDDAADDSAIEPRCTVVDEDEEDIGEKIEDKWGEG